MSGLGAFGYALVMAASGISLPDELPVQLGSNLSEVAAR